MFVFMVASNVQNPELEAKIMEAYPSDNLRFSSTVWFVADAGVTAKEVCEKINVIPGGLAGVVVTKVETYFGFAPTVTWEWLKARMGIV
ncbi:hypothetical protein [Methylocystis iwaonis]|uniref:Lrp/AsnC family transcriptional regulator n=1 Tax=Methylocystis iwaonis TaxID=2885079 RepID=A0ABN6VFC0_9HYPH|nr:hypothetical protein [Methylocystis iwaonis]BDV34253.1 hypothetical protein SS37A_17820 [Methylocystis iwaonis]